MFHTCVSVWCRERGRGVGCRGRGEEEDGSEEGWGVEGGEDAAVAFGICVSQQLHCLAV